MEFKERGKIKGQYLGTVTFVPTAENGYFENPDLPHKFDELVVFDVHPKDSRAFERGDMSELPRYADLLYEGTFWIPTGGFVRGGITTATLGQRVIKEIPPPPPRNT